MLALLRVAVLVERRAVEARERVRVLRKVPRHPVEQHADAVRMQLRDELAQFVRRAVAARRREVAGALIAPRIVERMLGDRQQLDVREAEIRDVRAELLGDLAVAQESASRAAAPGAEVNLVDRHRLAQPVALARVGASTRRPSSANALWPRRDGRGRRALLERAHRTDRSSGTARASGGRGSRTCRARRRAARE